MKQEEIQREIIRLQAAQGVFYELVLSPVAEYEIKTQLNRRLAKLVNLLFNEKMSKNENQKTIP